jgi:uncharacterized BrkB/YihY/UPF0761 family membrane protein
VSLLIWMWLSAYIILLGEEVNALFSKSPGDKAPLTLSGPDAAPDAIPLLGSCPPRTAQSSRAARRSRTRLAFASARARASGRRRM